MLERLQQSYRGMRIRALELMAEVARRSFLLLQNPLVKAEIDQYKKRLDGNSIN